jgi:hypothetical protein
MLNGEAQKWLKNEEWFKIIINIQPMRLQSNMASL